MKQCQGKERCDAKISNNHFLSPTVKITDRLGIYVQVACLQSEETIRNKFKLMLVQACICLLICTIYVSGLNRMYTSTALGLTIDDLTHVTAGDYAIKLSFPNNFWELFKLEHNHERKEGVSWLFMLEEAIRGTLENETCKVSQINFSFKNREMI